LEGDYVGAGGLEVLKLQLHQFFGEINKGVLAGFVDPPVVADQSMLVWIEPN
jgi:hypothetical protein